MKTPAIQLRAYDAGVKGRRAVAFSARLFANPWWRRSEVAVCAVAEESCDRNAGDNGGRWVQAKTKTVQRYGTFKANSIPNIIYRRHSIQDLTGSVQPVAQFDLAPCTYKSRRLLP